MLKNIKVIGVLICFLSLLPIYAQDASKKDQSKTDPPKAKVDLNEVAQEITFDLKNNLNLAHFYRDGLIIDPTEQSVIKYLRDDQKNWLYGHVKDGRQVMMPKSVQARFWVPLTPELKEIDLQLEVILKPADASQKMDLFFDDQKIAHEIYKTAEWTHKIYKIPANLAKEGLHLIKFHFSKRFKHDELEFPAWFRLLRISANETMPLPDVETDLSKFVNTMPMYDRGIALEPNQSLEYYINPPKEGVLTATVKGGEIEILSQQKVGDASKSFGKFNDKISIPLNVLKGNATRLVVKYSKGKPAITAQIAPTEIAPNEVIKPNYVVFWLVDTLRADKLPFYQMKNSNQRNKVKTPNLTAFSKESSIFEPFYVQGNESKASHASLFSGTYPVKHKVYDHDAKLSDSYVTIAEAFKEQKYKTAGFVANGYISDKWGYTQGFDFFENYIRENRPNSAAYINKQTFEWINQLKELVDDQKKKRKESFYAYLGTSDPHVSYRVHEAYMPDYDPEEYDGLFKNNVSGEELEEIKSKKRKVNARDKVRIEAMYENEIAYNDEQFGKMIEYLKAKKIYDETLIVVTADHGEEFWEHGSCGHGHSLFQELVAVPLLIKWPKNFPAKRIDMGVDGTDLLPTLMAMIGAKIPGSVQGRNILPYLNAKNIYPQAILASKGNEKYAIQIGHTKVIYQSPESINAYNIASDFKEAKNVADQNYILTLSGLDPILLYLSRPRAWNKSNWGVPNVLSKKFPRGFPASWKK